MVPKGTEGQDPAFFIVAFTNKESDLVLSQKTSLIQPTKSQLKGARTTALMARIPWDIFLERRELQDNRLIFKDVLISAGIGLIFTRSGRGDTAKTVDPSWPRGYLTPCDVMFSI